MFKKSFFTLSSFIMLSAALLIGVYACNKQLSEVETTTNSLKAERVKEKLSDFNQGLLADALNNKVRKPMGGGPAIQLISHHYLPSKMAG